MIKTLNHIFHRLNYILAAKPLWKLIAFLSIAAYLLPLIVFGDQINILIFDNLDSNVVWYKILAESGMIFAPNDAIIPNMMNGLPRLSYGSEFKILLWLYYFFPPFTAYIINEITMHIVAFVSMFLLANRYLVPKKLCYRNTIVYFLAIVFALLPFWPSGGLSIPVLPLVTYILVNIFYRKDTYTDWIILLLIPFYSSFIFVYIFYIGFSGLFLLINIIYTKKVHWRFMGALILLTTIYILLEYRLFEAMFLHNSFISHRSEFNIFFSESFLDATRRFYLFFLNGHATHLKSIQMPFLLPTVLFSALLLQFKRRLSAYESVTIFSLFAISLWLGIWNTILGSIYSIPIIIIFATSYMFIKKDKNPLLLSILIYIAVSAIYGYVFYDGFSWITELFPIFKSFSLARASFIQPLVFIVLMAFALKIIFRKMHFQVIFIIFLLTLQLYALFFNRLYTEDNKPGFASFQDYYAIKQFNEIKKDIKKDIKNIRVVSYGIEPAVALYNGFYTVDGYSMNYPLSYKHIFQNVNIYQIDDPFLTQNNFSDWKKKVFTADKIFDEWGSKLYILTIESSIINYKKGLVIYKLNFNEDALLNLGTDYLISSYELFDPKKRKLSLVKKYMGEGKSWDIYLYKFSKN